MRVWPYVPSWSLERVLDDYADLDPEAPCWLSDDAGDSFCLKCATVTAKERNAEIDGGFSGGESDHCEHCKTCGCLLQYCLTDYGAASELDHYRQYPLLGLPSRQDAYHLSRMLAAKPDDDEAAEICERAVVEIVRMQA